MKQIAGRLRLTGPVQIRPFGLYLLNELRTSLVVQMVKYLPAMQETCVQSLGWEDLLEKGMATYSSILVWRIPWAEELGKLKSMGSQSVGHN